MTAASRRLKYVSKALRYIPPGMRGKTRLARLMLGSSSQAEDVEVVDKFNCSFVLPSLREPIGFHLLISGTYEDESLNFILQRLTKGSVFIDVGANVGTFALPASRKVGPEGKVIAIESSPRIFSYLQHNIRLNQASNVHPLHHAVYSQDQIDVPFYEAPADHFGMGSIGAQFHADPIHVPAITLDRVVENLGIDHVDMIKIDVEGFEAHVIQGAHKLLTSDHAPQIVFEFCDWAEARVPGGKIGDTQHLLKQLGYNIWRLEDFLRGREPLNTLLTQGFETLLAVKS